MRDLCRFELPQLGSWIGFDPLFSELERVANVSQKINNWPPYNVRKIDDTHYVVEMAVAGFSKADIDISTQNGKLIVKGEVKAEADDNYVVKGIAQRNFERYFTLAESVVVNSATLMDGMLKIAVEQLIPDHRRQKKIEICDTLNTVVDTKQLLTE